MSNELLIATQHPAGDDVVQLVMSKPAYDGANDDDNRSGWQWIRLANGDLILGVYPHGETCFEVEKQIERDYDTASKDNTVSYTYLSEADVQDQGFGIAKIY